MFKPESWQSHSEYRTFVTAFRRRLSRNYPKYHFDSYEKEYRKLLELDLDPPPAWQPFVGCQIFFFP